MIESAETWILEVEEEVYQEVTSISGLLNRNRNWQLRNRNRNWAKKGRVEKRATALILKRSALTRISEAQVKCSSLSQELKHQLQKYQQVQHSYPADQDSRRSLSD